MPKKNPLGTIKDVADVAMASVVSTVSESVKDPVGTGQKMVGSAVGQAVAVAGAVSTKLPRRKRKSAPKAPSGPVAVPAAESRKAQGDPVAPAFSDPAAPTAKKAPANKAPAEKAPAKKAPAKTAAKKAPVKKTATKKAPVKKTAAKTTAVKKTPSKKAPAKKSAAKKG